MEVKNDKIVITGSSGRIGRAIHWKLAVTAEVTGIDVSPSSATAVIQDITNGDRLKSLFEGVSTVYHAAALHAPHVGVASESDFFKINVEATKNVIEAALANGVTTLVFTSTTALYGYANLGQGKANWIDESTVPEPRTIYHRTKLDAENLLKDYTGKGLRIRVIRMSRCFPEPVNQMAVYRLHRGIDYRDVADAHIASAAYTGEEIETFVVSGKTPFSKNDCTALYEDAESVIRSKYPQLAADFDKRGWQLPQSIDRVYDASYAEKKLSWQTLHGPMDVLKRFEENDYEVLPFLSTR